MQTEAKAPWLFVIGAPKAGTTALFDYLLSAPGFRLPKSKEIHFFSREKVASSYYRPKIPASLSKYFELFDNTSENDHGNIRCDVSPSYLYSQEAIKEIKLRFPNRFFIVLLRDPLKRAYSHYQMDYQKGLCSTTLLEILENPDKHPMHFEQYIEFSRYKKYLDQLKSIIPEEQLGIFSNEALRDSPADLLNSVLRHFDKPPLRSVFLRSTRSNAAFVPKSALVRAVSSSHASRRVFSLLPADTRSSIRRLVTKPPLKNNYTRIEGQRMLAHLADEQKWFRAFIAGETAESW